MDQRDVSKEDWLYGVLAELATQPVLNKHLSISAKMRLESINGQTGNAAGPLKYYWSCERELVIQLEGMVNGERRSIINGVMFEADAFDRAIKLLLAKMTTVEKLYLKIEDLTMGTQTTLAVLLKAIKSKQVGEFKVESRDEGRVLCDFVASFIRQLQPSLKTLGIYVQQFGHGMHAPSSWWDCIWEAVGNCPHIEELQIVGEIPVIPKRFVSALKGKLIRSLDVVDCPSVSYGFEDQPPVLQAILEQLPNGCLNRFVYSNRFNWAAQTANLANWFGNLKILIIQGGVGIEEDLEILCQIADFCPKLHRFDFYDDDYFNLSVTRLADGLIKSINRQDPLSSRKQVQLNYITFDTIDHCTIRQEVMRRLLGARVSVMNPNTLKFQVRLGQAEVTVGFKGWREGFMD